MNNVKKSVPIVRSLFYLAIGILCMLNFDNPEFLPILLGILFIVGGIVGLLIGIFSKKRDNEKSSMIVEGVLSIILGISLLCLKALGTVIIIEFIGIFMLVCGISTIFSSVAFREYSGGAFAAALLGGILMVLLSMLCLSAQNIAVLTVFAPFFAGIALILLAIFQIITKIIEAVQVSKRKKAEKAKVVEG